MKAAKIIVCALVALVVLMSFTSGSSASASRPAAGLLEEAKLQWTLFSNQFSSGWMQPHRTCFSN